MQDTWEYIESYFTQALSSEERKNFEMRIEQDASFAKEVAFYLTARSAAREVLTEEKQRPLVNGKVQKTANVQPATVRKMPVRIRKWLPYMAAACVIVFIAGFFLFRSSSPQQLANNYLKSNYSTLNQTMDGSQDSLQLGIAAYNSKDYQRALTYFEGVRQGNPASSYAIKYAGLAFLQTNNYDKALQRFKELSANKGLYSNSGDFLQAVTLMKRNDSGDQEQAKQLLQKVEREDQDGSIQSKEWLEKLK
jgi:tetratricopeptide (TPR) repeat protein